ncbi:splicing factor 45 [Lethenteron reissneri]|uniref:splicing factor 45 n=1 Tax=Lethenteron reissneri TaxID=7753 RepID=UPI002AB5FE72|nr:splicing factor 45 [Lethenteron reissneri]
MSLYDDLRVERSDSKTEGWSKNFKLLQSQLQVKKAALTQAKNQRGKQSTVLAPVVDLKRNSGSDERTSFPEPPPPPPVATTPKESGAAQMAFMGEMLIPVADEYDPMYPNDYDKVVKRQREDRQRQREHERQKEIDDREKRRKERHEASGMSRRPESDDEEEYEAEKRKRGTMGAAIAPPSSLMERDKDLAPDDEIKRGRMSGKAAIPPPNYEDSGERPRSPPGGSSSFISNMGGTVAHKIMQKYGFREGQGLGKHEQGLSTALSVEKTSKRGGKIVIGDNVPKEAEAAAAAAVAAAAASAAAASASPSPASVKKQEPNPLTEILKNPTKVVLLRNMVGPGEVDEDLESETKEECEKYGKVIKCVIFEMPGAPEDDAVRIFLEFERMESAIKAVVDLNGRYFGGRIVKAGFYNLDKFRRLDLATSV